MMGVMGTRYAPADLETAQRRENVVQPLDRHQAGHSEDHRARIEAECHPGGDAVRNGLEPVQTDALQNYSAGLGPGSE
jgi:hypothetical protein